MCQGSKKMLSAHMGLWKAGISRFAKYWNINVLVSVVNDRIASCIEANDYYRVVWEIYIDREVDIVFFNQITIEWQNIAKQYK